MKKPSVLKPYVLVLNVGYAESQSLGSVPFFSKNKYATAKAAIIDLARFFKEQFEAQNKTRLRKCCEATLAAKSDAKFCPKCGSSLKIEDFDTERFIDFVRGIVYADTDNYHADFIDYDESHRWQFGDLERALSKSVSTRFVYVAEKVMAAAVGHSPDDRVTIESIFKNRTKSGSRSFSFW